MATKQKNSKQGRQKKTGQNARYINERRHEKSHVRRIERHLKAFPADAIALKELHRYRIKAGFISAKR